MPINQRRVARPLRSTRITRLHRYYGTVRPCFPLWYAPPHGFSRLEFFLCIGIAGSHVPCRSPNQARATFTPDTVWSVSRFPPDLSRDTLAASVSISSLGVSTRHRMVRFRSPSWSIPDKVLPRLFRNAHHPGSLPTQLAVVWDLPLQGDPGGSIPPSLAQHRFD